MRCYIGIGSNLGNRRKNIDAAIEKLRQVNEIEVKKVSSVYETEPVGGPKQPDYLNAVIEIETMFGPRKLLAVLHEIEDHLGRKRSVKDGSRTIDLDILTYGDEKINEPDLKIPHPRMNEREFVQLPLRELLKT
ncbi:MAG: 2-amino-4-hydroxy-6-hydroxymethyldihydropteridine diphosphokinase [Candidatus Omnitrophica bacterium]|nr:2-amino-4-hydroxy-6-hydroxymethyldihydropteridine diphosphokinase [Candidatus Omnitrophota bacterium]